MKKTHFAIKVLCNCAMHEGKIVLLCWLTPFFLLYVDRRIHSRYIKKTFVLFSQVESAYEKVPRMIFTPCFDFVIFYCSLMFLGYSVWVFFFSKCWILMSNRVVLSFFIDILNDTHFLFRIIRICRTFCFQRCWFDRDLSDSHRKNIIFNDVKTIRYRRNISLAKSYRCAELCSLYSIRSFPSFDLMAVSFVHVSSLSTYESWVMNWLSQVLSMF